MSSSSERQIANTFVGTAVPRGQANGAVVPSNPSIVPTSFVFKPGGVASENVFVTEASLIAALQETNGASYFVFFDIPATSYTFTTVGELNFPPNGIWTDGGASVTLIFANETTIANLPIWITGSLALVSNQVAPIITTSDAFILTMDASTSFTTSNGPFVSSGVPEAIYGIVILKDNVFINGTNAFYGNSALTVFKLYLDDGASLGPNCVGGVAESDIQIVSLSTVSTIDSSLYPRTSITGLFVDFFGTAVSTIQPVSSSGIIFDATTGKMYWTFFSTWQRFDAAIFAYNAATLANWSGTNPSSIGEALDRIAAHVGPIP